MKHLLAATALLLVLTGAAAAQTYSSMGEALYAKGYTATLWVNSFAAGQPYAAHGEFYPAKLFVNGDIYPRYGMQLDATAAVRADTDGLILISGSATNPNDTTADGSLTVDLLQNGNTVSGGSQIVFSCPPHGTCPWSLKTSVPWTATDTWTARAYRHIFGAIGGNELTAGGPGQTRCRSAVIAYFNLPSDYVFTTEDYSDWQYVCKPGDTASAAATFILPVLCNNTSTAPVASFTYSPSVIYPGTPVTFSDSSSGGPTSWSWSFQDGTSSSAPGPTQQVTFASIGAKTVTLTASNSSGSSSSSQTVSVLDPSPAGSLAASPSAISACQNLDLVATMTGAPPLTYTWELLDAAGAPVVPATTSGSSTFSWVAPANATPGSYTGRVTVRNDYNLGGLVRTVPVTVSALGTLTDIGNQAPTVVGTFISNSFQLVAPTFSGASRIVWDFGDGTGATFTDPVAGASPTHTWAQPGSYSVKVTISNCVDTTGSTSLPATVQVGRGGNQLQAIFSVSDAACQFGPCSVQQGNAVTFSDSSLGAVVWDYDWTHTGTSFSDCSFGDAGHGTPVPSHVFSTTGSFNPCLRVHDAAGALSTMVLSKTITVVAATTQAPQAHFTFTPTAPKAGDVVTFDASASTGVPTGAAYAWSFGDGASTTGKVVMHAFAAAASYPVKLTITPSGCSAASCAGAATQSVVVAAVTPPPPPPPPPPPTFTSEWTSSACGTGGCAVEMGKTITLSAVAQGATGYWWTFGDGGATMGAQVTHQWNKPGSYPVMLNVAGAGGPVTHTVVVSAVGPQELRTVLPTLFETGVPLVQTDSLYLYNPGATTLDVSLAMRLEGAGGNASPPQVTAHVAPHSTFAVPNLAGSQFQVGQASGFLTMTTSLGAPAPVVASFYDSGRKSNRLFGATQGASSLDGLVITPAGPEPPQQLIGLSDTADRRSTFGVTNATSEPAFYRVRVLDRDGNVLGQSNAIWIDRYAQNRYMPAQIRQLFGVSNDSDYRVEISTTQGVTVKPFAADLRVASGDRAFLQPVETANRVYLLGVQNVAARAGVQTDLLLGNPADQPIGASIAFTPAVGSAGTPTTLTVQPGATLRAENVLATRLGVRGATGVLTVTGGSAANPLVEADSYDNTNPRRRYGQRIPALSDADAATVGQRLVLLPLRQDAANRTTIWLFNPGSSLATVDVVYRGFDGTVLGTLSSVALNAGQALQLDSTKHPLAKTGVPGGFAVEVVVRAGKALAAAQVVRTSTADPAYVAGQVR